MRNYLEKHEAILTKIKNLKNIELDGLPVHDDRYIKTIYTKFRDLNVSEYDNKILIF